MSAAEITQLEAALAQDVRMSHLTVRMARQAEVVASREAALMMTDAQWRQTRVKGGMETEISAQTAMLRSREARRKLAAAQRSLAAAEADFAHHAPGPADDSRCAPGPATRPIATHPTVVAALSRARATSQEVRADIADGGFWPRFFEVTWDGQPDEPGRTFLEVGIPLSFTGPALADLGEAAVTRAKAELQATVDETQREIALAEADLAARKVERDAVPPGKSVAGAQAVAVQAESFGGDPRQKLALERALLREEARRDALVMAVEAAEIRLRAARGHR